MKRNSWTAVNSVLKSECQWAVNKVSCGGAPELLKPMLYNLLRPHHSHTLRGNLPVWTVRFLPPHPVWKLNTRLSWFQRCTLAFWLRSSLMFAFMLLTFFIVRRQESKWICHLPVFTSSDQHLWHSGRGMPQVTGTPTQDHPTLQCMQPSLYPIPVGCQTWDHSRG